jgi:glycine/D-amino acid oxidase-like deaminating enzyme
MSGRTLIIGGGIVGLAVARELSRRDPGRSIVLLEKGKQIARLLRAHDMVALCHGDRIGRFAVHDGEMRIRPGPAP